MTDREQDDHDVLLDDGDAGVHAAVGVVDSRPLRWRGGVTCPGYEVTSSARETRGARLEGAVDGVADQLEDQREGQMNSMRIAMATPVTPDATPRLVAS